MEGRGKQAEAQRPGPSVVAVLLPIFIMSHSSVATNTLLKRTKGKREHAHSLATRTNLNYNLFCFGVKQCNTTKLNKMNKNAPTRMCTHTLA